MMESNQEESDKAKETDKSEIIEGAESKSTSGGNVGGKEKDQETTDDEDPPCIWDHYYKFCGVKVLIHEDYDAGLGGTMFDGALCLCNYIEHLVETNQRDFKLTSVVELGAGCGLPGLLLAGLGARVVLTDIEDTVELLEENIENNTALLVNGCGEASAAILDWTKKSDLVAFKPPYEYILAADTVYSSEAVVAFLETAHYLSSPETVIFFAHPAPRQPEASELFWTSVDYYFHVEKVEPAHFVPNLKSKPTSFASSQRGVFLLKKKLLAGDIDPVPTKLESNVSSLST